MHRFSFQTSPKLLLSQRSHTLKAYSKDQVEQVDTIPCKSKEFGNQVVISAWEQPFMEERDAEQNLLPLQDSGLGRAEDKGCSHSTAHWGGDKPNTFPGSFLPMTCSGTCYKITRGSEKLP